MGYRNFVVAFLVKMKNKEKILIIGMLLLYCALLRICNITCPILYLTGMACPGCGMTRALIACLKFDFPLAFRYHPMVFSLPYLTFYFFCDGKVFRSKMVNYATLLIVGLGFIINWIINIISFTNWYDLPNHQRSDMHSKG